MLLRNTAMLIMVTRKHACIRAAQPLRSHSSNRRIGETQAV